jgi:nucleoside-diphosphate-sugar epimerase
MKKVVFITGATGNMGWAGFKELYQAKDQYKIKLLARDSKKNRKMLTPYLNDDSVEVIWGDLCNYADVERGVSGSNIVLHIGGMVSPAADYYPEKTLKVNVTAAEYVAKAVLSQPDADDIKVVYIGSVAQYGHKPIPNNHWGAVGDKVRASKYDMYSVSKCIAEKVIVDSGIKKWVSLRQSGILYPGILKVINPTAFHVPVAGVLEWSTVEDSGRLLERVCRDDVPDEFWNNFYNISSGEEYRMTNYEFETRLLKSLGLPGPEKVFEPQWFATQNFHGMWYKDADLLEEYLHFRANIPVDRYFKNMKDSLPWFYSLAFLAPAFAIKLFMRPFAFEKEMGTQWWIKNDINKTNAYYGSFESYKSIKTWEQMRPPYLEKNQSKAGIERVKPLTKSELYKLSDVQIANIAEQRGGKFIGPKDVTHREPGALYEWRCDCGNEFQATLEYIVLGGGWCCESDCLFD